jgi:hypothetical protein
MQKHCGCRKATVVNMTKLASGLRRCTVTAAHMSAVKALVVREAAPAIQKHWHVDTTPWRTQCTSRHGGHNAHHAMADTMHTTPWRTQCTPRHGGHNAHHAMADTMHITPHTVFVSTDNLHAVYTPPGPAPTMANSHPSTRAWRASPSAPSPIVVDLVDTTNAAHSLTTPQRIMAVSAIHTTRPRVGVTFIVTGVVERGMLMPRARH